MAKKLFPLFIYFIFSVSNIWAQQTLSPSDFKDGGKLDHDETNADDEHDHGHQVTSSVGYWALHSDNLDTFRIDVDTVLHGFHNYNPIFKESISNTNLGNLGSPYISNIYVDRPDVDFLFADVYHAFLKTPELLPIVNTRTPFTMLSYANGGPKKYAEETVNGFFSQNVNKDINIGFYFDILYALGRYDNSSTRNKSYGGFASYMKPRYNAFLNIGTSNAESYENGGIGNDISWQDEFINDPNSENAASELSSTPENYPVRLSGGRSYLEHDFIDFKHKYNLGVLREVELADSTEEQFVSAVNIVHQFKFQSNIKQYEDSEGKGSYYNDAFIDSTYTLDSLRSRTFSNRIGLYLDEGINQFGKFGAGAYLQMDNIRINNNPWASIEDTTLVKSYSNMLEDNSSIVMDSVTHEYAQNYSPYKTTNIYVGGSIFKRTGTHFFFDASGQLCLAGYNSGDWKLDGNVKQVFPNFGRMELSARASLDRKKADYIQQQYHSNNFWWNNDFDPVTRQSIGGTLKIPSINFEASIDLDNIQDYIYYGVNALPTQHEENIAVLTLQLKKDFEIGKHLVWENNIIYQETSSNTALPLPELSVYTNLYYRNILFDVLHFEIGVDCRYHTAYNAPGYMPATGRFYNQQDVEIGNYPMMNAYADFFLRRMRFFVMETHVNYGWPSYEYFSAPHYGYNHRMFKMGLEWTFYD